MERNFTMVLKTSPDMYTEVILPGSNTQLKSVYLTVLCDCVYIPSTHPTPNADFHGHLGLRFVAPSTQQEQEKKNPFGARAYPSVSINVNTFTAKLGAFFKHHYVWGPTPFNAKPPLYGGELYGDGGGTWWW